MSATMLPIADSAADGAAVRRGDGADSAVDGAAVSRGDEAARQGVVRV
jgi:hypothetical protein